MLIRLVSISARVSTEVEELKRSQSMSSLWKLHADSLVVLLDISNTSAEEAAGTAKAAQQSGEAVRSIQESLERLRVRAELAARTLAHAGN
jgi:hypothetical protein